MGALIALRLSLAHPSRVKALVLMASLATTGSPEAIAMMLEFRDAWVSTGAAPSENIMNAAIVLWGGDPDVTGARAHRIKHDWVERHSGLENVDAILQSVNGRDDIRGRLHEIKIPVLIVHGELDETWKLEEARIARDGLINAEVRFKVIEGCGHLVLWIRDSEDVSEMIGDFLKEQMV